MKKQILIIGVMVAILVGTAYVFQKPMQGWGSGKKLAHPLSRFDERPKLLTFGLYVTPDPEQNPIDPPERFIGYHTALDLETFAEEANEPVDVYAICDGQIKEARTAEGYGGVMVQSCTIGRQEVTVLYGHVEPTSFAKKAGDSVARGEKIAQLADARSEGSGLTRKHLHLGIHKGSEVVLLGYVQDQKELENYIDPLPLLNK
jgi:murein DD-endopeptidase MepM/ murein hydrolase activator NlpD